MTAEPESADRRVGANVRLHRDRLGMKQADLARRMDWPQSTVARTEAGQRPIRVAEAEQLAEILEVDVARLLWAGGEAGEAALAERAIADLRHAWTHAAVGVGRLLSVRAEARDALTRARASSHARVRDLAAAIEAVLEECTPEAAMEQAAPEPGEDGNGTDKEA